MEHKTTLLCLLVLVSLALCRERKICIETPLPEECGKAIKCNDIDECAEGTHNCDVNAVCLNTFGSFCCQCEDGYVGDGVSCKLAESCKDKIFDCPSGLRCPDVNECELGTHDCDVHADCFNSIGSFCCACKDGYYGDGRTCLRNVSSVPAENKRFGLTDRSQAVERATSVNELASLSDETAGTKTRRLFDSSSSNPRNERFTITFVARSPGSKTITTLSSPDLGSLIRQAGDAHQVERTDVFDSSGEVTTAKKEKERIAANDRKSGSVLNFSTKNDKLGKTAAITDAREPSVGSLVEGTVERAVGSSERSSGGSLIDDRRGSAVEQGSVGVDDDVDENAVTINRQSTRVGSSARSQSTRHEQVADRQSARDEPTTSSQSTQRGSSVSRQSSERKSSTRRQPTQSEPFARRQSAKSESSISRESTRNESSTRRKPSGRRQSLATGATGRRTNRPRGNRRSSSPCENDNGGCAHVCVATGPNTHSCFCDPGYKLQADKLSCTHDPMRSGCSSSFVCPKNGMFRNPNHCGQFFVCTGIGTLWEWQQLLDCAPSPELLIFNEAKRECQFSHRFNEKVKSSCTCQIRDDPASYVRPSP